jgi:hypothetical protein
LPALAVSVLLAQAAFWAATAVLHSPLPPPSLDLDVTAEGYYLDSRESKPFALFYSDHVSISLMAQPPTSVSLSIYSWEDWEQLQPAPPIATASAFPYVDRAGALAAGCNLLVAEGPVGNLTSEPVWYLPRANPYDMSDITRTIVITVTPFRLRTNYRVDFGPGAPQQDLDDLMAGRIPPGLFLKRLFYAEQVTFTTKALTEIGPPLLTARQGTSRIEIEAFSDEAFYNPERLPILLDISTARSEEQAGTTTVRVAASEGAQLTNCDPLPDAADGEAWTWTLNPGDRSPSVESEFGSGLNPATSPVAWGRFHLTWVARGLWAWRPFGRKASFGRYVVVILPWLVPWLYGLLASAPLLYLRATTRSPRERRLAAVGVGLALTLAWAVLTSQVAALLTRGPSASGLVWAGVLGGTGALVLFYYEPPPSRFWLLAATSTLGAGALMAAFARPGGWLSGLTVAVLSLPILAFVLWLGVCVWRRGGPGHKRRRWAFVPLVAALLLLAVPTGHRPPYYSQVAEAWNYTPGHGLARFTVWVGLPYVSLALLASVLRRYSEQSPPASLITQTNEATSMAMAVDIVQATSSVSPAQRSALERRLGRRERGVASLLTLLFAAFAIGLIRRPLTTYAALVPIGPLLAWGGFRLLLRPRDERRPPESLRILLAAPRRRREIAAAALGLSEEGENQEGSKGVDKEQSSIAEVLRPLTDQPGRRIRLPEVAFAWGGDEGDWRRAVVATTRALALVIPLGLAFAPALTAEVAARSYSAFGALEALAVFLGPFLLRWLLYAFVLGYGFPRLRGRNGWEKGLYLGLVAAVANLVQDIILYAGNLDDVKGLLLEAGVTILVLSIVGVWVFDWRRVAEAGGRPTDLRTLYGLSTPTSYLLSILPPVTTIVIEAARGRLDTLLRAFVSMVLPAVQL